MTNAWARRFVSLAAVVMLAACSHSEPATPNTAPVQVPAQLNRASAAQLMDAIVKAGLPAPNRRDTTAVKCPKLRCVQSIETDTVSVIKFAGTGPAQLYAAAISNMYQVEDVVLTFAPTVSAEQKRDYERVVDRAAF
jgi:hypothetical protein